MLSRINTAWVIDLERPFVGWLVTKLPAAVKPDHLTLTGFAGALICGLAYGASWLSPALLWVASAGLIINWFGDSLDGTLARFRKIERPRYGFFIDNTTDLLSQICIFFGLGKRSKIDLLEITWPSGQVDKLSNVDAGQTITVTEGKGVTGSRKYGSK